MKQVPATLPFPGKRSRLDLYVVEVTDVYVKVGDIVKKGDRLIEVDLLGQTTFNVTSEHNGTISSIDIGVGQTIESGNVFLHINVAD